MTFAMDKILNQETFNEIKKLFQIAKKPVLSSKDRTSETSVSLGDDLSLKILSRAIKNLIKDQNFKISELELETVGNVIFNVFTKKQHKIIDGTRLRPSGSQKLQSASQTR